MVFSKKNPTSQKWKRILAQRNGTYTEPPTEPENPLDAELSLAKHNAVFGWIRERSQNGIHHHISFEMLGISTLCVGHLKMAWEDSFEFCSSFGVKEYWRASTDDFIVAVKPNAYPITNWKGVPAIATRMRLNGFESLGLFGMYYDKWAEVTGLKIP